MIGIEYQGSFMMQHPKEASTIRPGEPSLGTILLIEDEVLTRQLIEQFLTDARFEVLVAEDGAIGIELFRQRPDSIDLIVLDLVMPRKNGNEVLKEIREIRPDLPAVVSTGCPGPVVIEALGNLPVSEVFFKPYRLSLLVRRVREILEVDQTSPPSPDRA